MSDPIDYSKLTNEQLDAIINAGEDKKAEPSATQKPTAPKSFHPLLGALGGGYLGSKAAAPITGWYAAKTASDIGDIATGMRAGQAIPNITITGAPEAPAPLKGVTGGERWGEKLTGAHVPGAQMAKEDLDLAKQMQRTIGRGGELAGGTIHEGILIGPKDAAALAEKAKHKAELNARIAEAEQSMQQRAAAAAERATKKPAASTLARLAVPSGALGKMANIGAPVLAGAGAGAEWADAFNRWQRGEKVRAGLSFLGGLGSAASAIPHPAARIGGTGVALAAPAINAAIDYFSPPQEAPAMAGSVMQGYADGGNVSNDQLMQMIRASRTARANNMQSRPGKYLTLESPNLRFVDQFADRNTTGEFIPSTRSMSLLRNPTGLNQDDMMTAAHEYQHFKDELAKNNPLNIRPEDSAMQDAIRAKINAYRDKPINLQTMPVDFDARSGLTGQQKPSEQLSQLAGYEAGLPAGMNIMQSGLGQTLTPQQKAMVLRRMNPLPQGVDAMVGGYATGGLANIK